MPRFDPALLPRAPVSQETRSFEIPGAPGPLTLTLRFAQGAATEIFLSERQDELYAEWGTPHGKPVLVYGEAPIPVGRRLCQSVALLMLGDSPQSGATVSADGRDLGVIETPEEPWTFHEWVVFSQRCPEVFVSIASWAWELFNAATGDEAPNASGAAAAN